MNTGLGESAEYVCLELVAFGFFAVGFGAENACGFGNNGALP